MAKVSANQERETLTDHLVAGILAALAMFATCAIAPIIVAMHAHGGGRRFFELFHGFYFWAGALTVIAFVWGLVVGPTRIASVFGHLWGTEDPPNRRVSWALWAGVVVVVAASWWIS